MFWEREQAILGHLQEVREFNSDTIYPEAASDATGLSLTSLLLQPQAHIFGISVLLNDWL